MFCVSARLTGGGGIMGSGVQLHQLEGDSFESLMSYDLLTNIDYKL